MDKQLGFGDCEFTQKRRTTRKEHFLAKMEELVLWDKPIPDESTVMNLRHLPEKSNLGEALFSELNS